MSIPRLSAAAVSLTASLAIAALACGSAAAAAPTPPAPTAAHSTPATVPGTLVPVPDNSYRVAVSPDGRYSYAASPTADTVTVVDVQSGTVSAIIPVGHGPNAVAFNTSGSRAYVTNSGDGTVSIIDTASMKVVDTINVGTPNDADNAIAVNSTATGDELYVAASHFSHIATYNVSTHARGSITVAEHPSAMVISDGQLVVGSEPSNANESIALIDLQTNQVRKTLPIPNDGGAAGMTTVDGTDTVVVTGWGFTSWLDLDTDHFTATLPVAAPGNLTGVASSTDGKYTFIATADFPDASNPANGTITAVDNTTHQIVNTITVGQFPWSIAATADSVVVPDAPLNGPTNLEIVPISSIV